MGCVQPRLAQAPYTCILPGCAFLLLMRPSPSLMLLCTFAWQVLPAHAAETEPKNRVMVIENVKLDYAQVLNVEPVYQTLRATRIEEQCESTQAAQAAVAPAEDEGRINRMVDSVKEMFSRLPEPSAPAAVPPTSTRRSCKVVEVRVNSVGRSPSTWITSTRAPNTVRGCRKIRATGCASGFRSPRTFPTPSSRRRDEMRSGCAVPTCVRGFAPYASKRLSARHQRRPDGLRHDLACPPTGIPHFRWVSRGVCCSDVEDPAYRLGFFVLASQKFQPQETRMSRTPSLLADQRSSSRQQRIDRCH